MIIILNLFRQEIIERLHNQYQLVVLVTENLVSYMESVREVVKGMLFVKNYPIISVFVEFFDNWETCLFTEHPEINPHTYFPDKRYNHVQQVQERLGFLKFLLKVLFLY